MRGAECQEPMNYFYSRPCGRGDQAPPPPQVRNLHFYSRPCGRGDGAGQAAARAGQAFLLTPLREGRL